MFNKILIANRGEIACRIIRTCKRMGILTVAVYSDADRLAQHVIQADEAFHIGGPRPVDSYLRADVIIDIAKRKGQRGGTNMTWEQLYVAMSRAPSDALLRVLPLTAEQSAKLVEALKKRLGRTIRLHAEVDPALVGGAVVRAGDFGAPVDTRDKRVEMDHRPPRPNVTFHRCVDEP